MVIRCQETERASHRCSAWLSCRQDHFNFFSSPGWSPWQEPKPATIVQLWGASLPYCSSSELGIFYTVVCLVICFLLLCLLVNTEEVLEKSHWSIDCLLCTQVHLVTKHVQLIRDPMDSGSPRASCPISLGKNVRVVLFLPGLFPAAMNRISCIGIISLSIVHHSFQNGFTRVNEDLDGIILHPFPLLQQFCSTSGQQNAMIKKECDISWQQFHMAAQLHWR